MIGVTAHTHPEARPPRSHVPLSAWVLAALILLMTPRPTLADTASPDTRNQVLLDGKLLPGITFERGGSDTWFPLQEIAQAAGLKLTLESDGTVRVGNRSFKATLRAVRGTVLVTRADVKRALNATIFLDPDSPRAVITTAGAQHRLAQKAGQPVESLARPAPTTQPGPPRANLPIHAGPNPTQPGPAQRAGKIGVFSVELDRTASQGNMMRVRARVRNDGPQALRSLTVTFVLWVDGEKEEPDELTGELVARGKLYSEYPQTLGDLEPGETKSFETVTTVANPDKIEPDSRIILLNVQSVYDSFAVRRLRYGFRAKVDTP